MGFFRRLLGGDNQASVNARPGLVAPVLPQLHLPELPPKSERPYRTSACPSCGIALMPPPKAKKACPGCHAAIYVKSSIDGYIDLIKDADRDAWEAADQQKRADAYERFQAQERAALRAAGFLVGESGWSVEVTGESHYQNALERIVGGLTEGGAHLRVVALLIREPTNRWDKNAIRVEVEGETVGYISRDECKDVQPLMRKLEAQGRPAWIRATINGGWVNENSRGSFGVVLDDLPEPDEI
jgi:hypothetical protein